MAVFPFNDIPTGSLNRDIPAILHAEFSGHAFIEVIPAEVITETLYEIGPAFMWAEQEGPEKRGGVLWTIAPKIVEKINETVTAQFSLYGNIMQVGGEWRVDAYILKEGKSGPGTAFTITGKNDEEVPSRVKEMSHHMAEWLERENVLNEAEEDIRHYMGGMLSYDAVTKKMENHVRRYGESVPLHALLLDLYLKERERNEEHIVNEGLQIIALLEETGAEDVRYLLSLSLDPFDAVAGVYERKEDWKGAITIRKNALNKFPFRPDVHENGLGRDHYFLARSLEKKGMKLEAKDNYQAAITYLEPLSAYLRPAKEGVERVKE